MGTMLLNEINVAFIYSISDLVANQEVRLPESTTDTTDLRRNGLLCLGKVG